MKSRLSRHPRCHQLRNASALARKVFDFFELATANQLLLLDSDVLFFHPPSRLLSHAIDSKPAFIRDVWSNYLVDPKDVQQRVGLRLPSHINVGCGVVPSDLLDLDFIEEVLQWPEFDSAPFFSDQTLLALLAARNGVSVLGEEYQMTIRGGGTENPMKHYTRLIRHLFYTEGVPTLRGLIGD